ncbi:LEA type 2 family protein [Hymenobacter sp. BT559]|uniref:NDR1/HIN1-like protein n=1 Tax=Hymenobacter sp. BT559 TaxID=2795729 RepID=UPI0018EC50FC|nr:LEA type 2 family protein [Hymenobacter sp. BT559]MBJ6146226.1 LEA type 2 family protein [Hymenobacter sp. BT559]
MKFALSLPRIATLVCLGLWLCASCTRRETRQEKGPSREPEFRVRVIEAASLNGLDVLPLHVPADLDLPRRNQVIAGYVNKQLPLRVRLQLNAYNPGLENVVLAGLDYAVLLDGRQLGTSRLISTLSLPPGDSVRVPLTFEFNTYSFLGDDAMPALRNFALGFGDPRRQRLAVRVRPLLRSPRSHVSQANRYSEPVVMAPATPSR